MFFSIIELIWKNILGINKVWFMKKIKLANLPTEIIRLEKISKIYNKNIYLKRDDSTGMEVSGNKIRKLEYSLAEALNENANTVITAGAIQSNHCRATAAACSKLGLECHLLLKGKKERIEGNLFLDYILGANIHYLDEEADISLEMEKLSRDLTNRGKRIYTIPIGASNAIGSYGYIDAYNEILTQEEKYKLNFDLISIPVGSGGTYSGLWYGNYSKQKSKRIVGFSVNNSKEEFKDIIVDILREIDSEITSFKGIEINDLYIGEGYAKATEEELKFYCDIARLEGVVFDPCYTGKAFRGLLKEIEKGDIKEDNILFIHTGGLLGWTEEYRNTIFNLISEENNR